ncbi:MAG: LPS assembly lipoprotein LptE [Acidobacteriota bacterium]
MKKKILLFCIILFTVLWYHCGYRLSGTGAFLPPYIKKICIPIFKNNTQRFEIDQILTSSVTDEMAKRGNFQVVGSEEASDATLYGEIIEFNVYPTAFGSDSRARKFGVIITAKVILKDLKTGKEIFASSNYQFRDEYDIKEGMDFFTLETEVINKISQDFAKSIVSTILEGF